MTVCYDSEGETMIFYATKETLERYKLTTPDRISEPLRPYFKAVIEREQGNAIYEWGCKLFYPDLTVHLTLFNATIANGEPQKLEHKDIQWITPSEIPNYDFCPADEELLAKISKVF